MPEKILILGDTHISFFKDLPEKIFQLIKEADWVIHLGDYISIDVLAGFRSIKGPKFKGVYGNADPLAIRNQLMAKEIFEIGGKRIGITHPAIGGSSKYTEKKVIANFKEANLDVIVYGHTHYPKIEQMGKTLIVNPGKGFLEKYYYGPPSSFVILIIDEKITGEIKIIKQ